MLSVESTDFPENELSLVIDEVGEAALEWYTSYLALFSLLGNVTEDPSE